MNYNKIYNDLIKRGRSRPLLENVYYEKHHIIPRCMKGTNDEDNIVHLTLREHYMAHALLYRIYKGTHYGYKLITAVQCMTMTDTRNTGRVKAKSKLYEWVHKAIRNEHKIFKENMSEEEKEIAHIKRIEISKRSAKTTKSNYEGLTPKEKIAADERRRNGRVKFVESLRIVYNLMTPKEKLIEDKRRRENWLGRKHTEETKKKMHESLKGKQSGIKNSQYGTCWIYNLTLKESKKIKLDDLDEWLNKDWLKGRKMLFY